MYLAVLSCCWSCYSYSADRFAQCTAEQRREYLQSSLRGKEIIVLNFLGEEGQIRAVLRFLREVNQYVEIYKSCGGMSLV